MDRIGQIAAGIEGGKVIAGVEEELEPGLAALLRGFTRAAGNGDHARGCVLGALAEIGSLPDAQLPGRPPPPADGTPSTGVSPMLFSASRVVFAGFEAAGLPNEPVDTRLLRSIAAIERASGVVEPSVRGIALSILADQDDAMEAIAVVDPPPIALEVFQMHLTAVMDGLAALRAATNVKQAA